MDQVKFNQAVKELREIVDNQVQTRTNKLKPLVSTLEEAVTYIERFEAEAPAITPNTDPEHELDHSLRVIMKNFGLSAEESLDVIKIGLERGNENRYLKRKITMYDLKIAKLEKELKDAKGKGK